MIIEKELLYFVIIERHLMYRYTFRQLNIYLNQLKSFRSIKKIFISIFILFIFMQYLCIQLINRKEIPPPILTRLYPDEPITINLRPYPICHPKEFYLENLTSQYHQIYPNKEQQTCFLIENLDGGSWWSYVSQEFAEILTNLKELGIQSNITYRSFPNHIDLDYKTDLRKYFLNACDINEKISKENQVPIIILLWNINRLLWDQMHYQWKSLLKTTRIRLLVFIDDLHFATKKIYSSRQYLFQFIASEILSTYPYLFHNYYYNISPNKITWLPHAASTLSYRSINQTAEYRLFVSGANLKDWYPCRWNAFSVCRLRTDLAACLKHPGYGDTMKNDSSFYYGGKRYFSYMRKYVFGLGTCQSVHYSIGKLFELPANGLVLVTTDDLVPILTNLHLYLNEHFLTIDCSSRTKLIKEIIRIKNISKENLFKIRKKSQEIIFERHLTKHRAELLHTRLLSQALIASSISNEENTQWQQWGRNCYEL